MFHGVAWRFNKGEEWYHGVIWSRGQVMNWRVEGLNVLNQISCFFRIFFMFLAAVAAGLGFQLFSLASFL